MNSHFNSNALNVLNHHIHYNVHVTVAFPLVTISKGRSRDVDVPVEKQEDRSLLFSSCLGTEKDHLTTLAGFS